ncbi:hypothetical protein ES288_A04G069900v1 [Gossypium darwinii]|uniref:Prolamin-like domain-containing protein n=1 Tax=Gossypium darwinii TaxID=34276 RepID=A0A5D2GV24_GOSDA|nr:hypothetical protein ES288_A04G069900v1 [Gossypium darwinii]
MGSLNVYSVLVVLFLTCGVVMATFHEYFNTGSISNKCCSEIVVLGKVCHSALVKRTLENPVFKDLNPATIIVKRIQTWNNCLALIYSPSPSA